MRTLVFMVFMGVISVGSAKEPLIELGTYGSVVDVSNYVMRLVNSRDPSGAASRLVKKASRFAVESPGISAGVFESKGVDLPQLTSPICIVGADELSLQWIELHREALVSSGAICIVTNVVDETEVQVVRDDLLPVPMFAAAVNDLLEPIGVDRYPVLISQTAAEQ